MDKQQFLDLVGLSTFTSEILGKTAGKIHTHTKSQITDFPTSMPASDVKAWAKAAAKPTYTPTEVGVIGPAPTSGQVAVFDGTTGKIKSTGFTIATSVPSGAKFTDTVFVHPSYTTRSSGLYKITVDGTGHVSGVTAVTKDDITALGIPGQDTNTTYSVFKGATADASGTVGLVSAPAKGQQALYLRGDGTWATPTNTTYGLASATTNGLLSSADFAKIAKFTATEAGYLSGVTSAIQTQLNGKASSSHGTHVTYGSKTTALVSGGTGAVGTSSALAREDHTHTLPAYPTALKNPTALTISLNGTSQGAYDGSAAKSFNITPAAIGAATASHSHSYLPLSGGNITGPIKSNFSTGTWLSGNQGNALLSSTATAGAYVALVRYPSKNGVFCISGYEEQIHIVYTSNATISAGTNTTGKDVTLLNESGNTIFPGSVTAASFSGNASSATKATQDSAGQQINSTYLKALSVSGKTITFTRGDGSTGTITTQDTNTTYGTGTATALGLTKLYTGTGSATDGTLTQKAITDALNGKAPSSHTHTKAQITDFPASLKNPTALTLQFNGTTNQTYDGSTAKTFNVTPAAIGALASGGTAVNASKVANSIVIKLNGGGTEDTNLFTFNGSAAKTINITPASIGAAASSHSHNYAGSSSAGGSANTAVQMLFSADTDMAGVRGYDSDTNTSDNGVLLELYTGDNGNEPIVARQYSGGGSTPGTNIARTAYILDGSGNTSFPGTISEAGTLLSNKYAAKSHGTHVSYGTATTALTSGGTGTVGTAATLARSDHTHTLPAYPSALKNPTALTISLNGTSQGAYDGSAAKSINITAASVGAAASSHSHSYLPLTGGTITGNVTAPTFTGALKGNADTATRANQAIQDNGGNDIYSTYIKRLQLDRSTLSWYTGQGPGGSIKFTELLNCMRMYGGTELDSKGTTADSNAQYNTIALSTATANASAFSKVLTDLPKGKYSVMIRMKMSAITSTANIIKIQCGDTSALKTFYVRPNMFTTANVYQTFGFTVEHTTTSFTANLTIGTALAGATVTVDYLAIAPTFTAISSVA